MISPLARPPIGPHSLKPHDEPRPATGGYLSRFLEELAGFYDSADPRRMAWSAARVLPDFTFTRTRARLLAMVGCDVQPGTGVFGYVDLVGPAGSAAKLSIGSGSIIAPGATFCLDAAITIGKNVSIGPRVMLYTATHPLGGADRRMQLYIAPRPIVIEDGVWVGLAAMILAGVRLGRGCVVAAGAVVSADVPPNALVAGNPATIVEQLPG
jgi:acetyltransferase-like isoleucine patch superfamily enzyme